MCVIMAMIVFKCSSVLVFNVMIFLFEFMVRSRTLDPDP